VSDSYDLWNAIDTLWGVALKEAVEESGGTLVVRPDSGDPVEIVSGTIEHLMNKFGFAVNARGYKVLPRCVRVIQGDGISLGSIERILEEMKRRKLSADNIAFGMGGELLQKVNRDTQKFAMKACAVCVNGTWRDVFKDPVTDPGKRSKAGRQAVVRHADGSWLTLRESELGEGENLLRVVFRNGSLLSDQTLASIRTLAG
jgi:nicotinamide phosphoribosyltransferase